MPQHTPDGQPLPLLVQALDGRRKREYARNLAFYRGEQWEGRPRRGERRLTFNYARALVDKVTGYLLAGSLVQVEGSEPQDLGRARAAEQALRTVEHANALSQLDYETELDCAVLGDGCYCVGWDAASREVRVTAPDVQGMYAWRRPDDSSRLTAIASQYHLPDGTLITEYWTDETFELWHGAEASSRGPNPYGFIPFVLFPNLREPKQPWGTSDVPALIESSRELNRSFSQLSQILELSGNPIAVLEGVTGSRDIAVEPGAVWEVPESARAYLLDLLQGGGVALHRDYIELVYRTLHDLGEAPRTAFGHNPQGLSGVALNTELDPIARKVERKRRIRTSVYARRAAMVLRLLQQFEGLDTAGLRTTVQWGPVLPQDRSRQVSDERKLVDAGIQSRRTAAARLGSDDPEAEWARVLEEAAVPTPAVSR